MKLNANDYEPKDIMKIIRQWTELSQHDFARSVGKSVSTIQAYEQGVRGYTMATLLKIANKHGVKIVIEK